MKIEINRLEEFQHPMATPAGWVEKKFRAIITELDIPSVSVIIDIEIRGQDEKFGNQIIAERILVEQVDQESNGVTGELLRRIPVKMLIEASVNHAINIFYPQTKPSGRQSLNVPTKEQLNRMEQIAAIANDLGVRPSERVIAEKLSELGVSLKEGTIRNYLTKAKRAGMINVYTDGDLAQLPSFQEVSDDGAYIYKEFEDAVREKRLAISPQQRRRDLADEVKRKDEEVEKTAKIRERDLAKRNPTKQKGKINEKRNPKAQ
jgi:hypothetical protein